MLLYWFDLIWFDLIWFDYVWFELIWIDLFSLNKKWVGVTLADVRVSMQWCSEWWLQPCFSFLLILRAFCLLLCQLQPLLKNQCFGYNRYNKNTQPLLLGHCIIVICVNSVHKVKREEVRLTGDQRTLS